MNPLRFLSSKHLHSIRWWHGHSRFLLIQICHYTYNWNSNVSTENGIIELMIHKKLISLDNISLFIIQRMKELQSNEASSEEKMLRLSVETGGCSGFQYVFDLDNKTNSDDRFLSFDMSSMLTRLNFWILIICFGFN